MGKFGKYRVPKIIAKKVIDPELTEESEEVFESHEELFIGKSVSLVRKLEHKYHPKENEIHGTIVNIDFDSHNKPVLIVEYSENGRRYKAHLIYSTFHKKSGEFVEADSSWYYIFSAADEETNELLDLFISMYYKTNESNDSESADDDQDGVQIVSIGNVEDDKVMMTIITVDGNEEEVEFIYNPEESCLDAEHDGHTYTIPLDLIVDEDDMDNDDEECEDCEKARTTFNEFVNECWTPMEEGYNPALSEEAKRAIKALCENVLIKEAQTCDEDYDPNHTYENYLNECGHYMTQCMMEAATNLKVK